MATLSSLLSWFSGDTPSGPPSVTTRVLRVPADGSTPHILPLQTIEISNDGNTDCFLCHVLDTRAFWGQNEGWLYRDVARFDLKIGNRAVDGVYYGFKSFALDHLPQNKAAADWGIWGDAFVAKVTDAEYGEHGWATYEDVPDELLRTGLYKRILERLAAM